MANVTFRIARTTYRPPKSAPCAQIVGFHQTTEVVCAGPQHHKLGDTAGEIYPRSGKLYPQRPALFAWCSDDLYVSSSHRFELPVEGKAARRLIKLSIVQIDCRVSRTFWQGVFPDSISLRILFIPNQPTQIRVQFADSGRRSALLQRRIEARQLLVVAQRLRQPCQKGPSPWRICRQNPHKGPQSSWLRNEACECRINCYHEMDVTDTQRSICPIQCIIQIAAS